MSDEIKELIKKLRVRILARNLYLYNSYSRKEIGHILDIHERTIEKWISNGKWSYFKSKFYLQKTNQSK